MATPGSQVVGQRYPLTAAEDAALSSRWPDQVFVAAVRDLVLAGAWGIEVLKKKGWVLTRVTRVAVPLEQVVLENPLSKTVDRCLRDQISEWGKIQGANLDQIIGGELTKGWSLEDIQDGAAMRLSELDLADLQRSVGDLTTQRVVRRPRGDALCRLRDFWVIWTQPTALRKLNDEEAAEMILGAGALVIANPKARERLLELHSRGFTEGLPERQPLRAADGHELGDLGPGIDLKSLFGQDEGPSRLESLAALDGMAETMD